MNRPRSLFPLAALGLLWIGFAAYVSLTSAHLPERVATHFAAGGEPNGWMTRSSHVQFTILSSLLVPGFILGIFFSMNRFGDRWMNLPHKDYWLASERRAETFAFVQRQGVWFAAMFIVFLAGIHHSTIVANTRAPASLPGSEVAWVAGPYLAATVLWVVIFVVRFARRPA